MWSPLHRRPLWRPCRRGLTVQWASMAATRLRPHKARGATAPLTLESSPQWLIWVHSTRRQRWADELDKILSSLHFAGCY
ncbi:hypothetical protein Y032_0039g130 [Ancylostoma ceylanicum]|uniref:Uncharacterized protein n=1 Tax=Ancylostoma ceylanicum TaxID=53326 RepID=A0A016UIM8_9BILA|nr:hypothetical protein Y032_0039g130 [Ancylostoma ceylanicum]